MSFRTNDSKDSLVPIGPRLALVIKVHLIVTLPFPAATPHCLRGPLDRTLKNVLRCGKHKTHHGLQHRLPTTWALHSLA